MKRKIDPGCKACKGTGKNSRGGLCSPCQANGVVVEETFLQTGPVKPSEPGDELEDAALEGF